MSHEPHASPRLAASLGLLTAANLLGCGAATTPTDTDTDAKAMRVPYTATHTTNGAPAYPMRAPGRPDADLREPGSVAMTCDDDALYLEAELIDRDLVALARGGESLFQNGDVCEWFIGPQRTTTTGWYLELHVAPDGQKRAYFFEQKGLPRDIDPACFDAEVELDGTVNASGDHDRGWTARFRLPWATLQRHDPDAGPRTPWTSLVGRYNYGRQLADGSPEHSTAPLQPKLNFHLREHHARLALLPRGDQTSQTPQ